MALEFLRRHSDRVRSLILKGVVAPQQRYTVEPAGDTQVALDRVITTCERDEGCRAKYPTLRDELAKLPVDADLGLELRSMLHSTTSIARIPALIHSGDRARIAAEAANYGAAVWRDVSVGMYLSVICAEDVWRVRDEDVARLTAGTIAGDTWHGQLVRACALWPGAPPNRAVTTPVQSAVPTLIISGAFDPVTPPRWGAAVARTLTNSWHIVVENGSHSFAGMAGCVDKIMSEFISKPDPRALDDSCVSRIALPAYEEGCKDVRDVRTEVAATS